MDYRIFLLLILFEINRGQNYGNKIRNLQGRKARHNCSPNVVFSSALLLAFRGSLLHDNVPHYVIAT